MDIWALVQDGAESLLAVFLPVVVAALAVWVRGVLQGLQADFESRVGERRTRQISEIVAAAVAASEQVGLRDDLVDAAASKRSAAINYAQGFLADHGITVNVTTLVTMIEAEVLRQFNWSRVLPPPTPVEALPISE